MVIDTSAILAILAGEPERKAFNASIASAASCSMSTGSYLETAIVVESRYGFEGIRDLQLLLSTAMVQLVPFDSEQALIARQAYARYGKGMHRVALDFGDCFAYALCKKIGEPLLYKGDDFSETDISPA
ncbi:MAG: type II toxin-antitoxin system VapC family toxin [Trueperaceae bacterium]